MRLTSTLYVRQWLAKLHPPLPQTPRESQQLLRILETSFRKHLDEVHPSPVQRQSSNPIHHDIPLTSPESSSNATNHYFHTVLNNPLLAKTNDKNGPQSALTLNAVNSFTEAYKSESITIPLLRRCALEYLQGLKNGERVHEKDRFAQKLASWVYTTSTSLRKAFFVSTEVLELAVRVVGIDRQEAIAWDWLRMLYEHNFTSEKMVDHTSVVDLQWLSAEEKLVSYLMGLSIRRGDLNDAAQQFVEACRYRTASGRAAARPEDVSRKLTYIPLENSWKRLAAAIIHYRHRHGISEALFSEVMSYGISWSLVSQFNTAIGLVYHPVSPSARSLSQNLQDAELADKFLSKQVGASKKIRRAMLIMILDGAQLSLEQGLRVQAQFLLDFARKHYTEFLPTTLIETSSSLDSQIHNAQIGIKAHTYSFAWA